MADRGNDHPLICLIGQLKSGIIFIIISLILPFYGCNSGLRQGSAVIPEVKLEVVNGTDVHRLGRAVERDLLARGFDVYRVSDAESVYAQTVVVDLQDPTGTNAQAVARALGIRRKRLIGILPPEMKIPLVQVQLDSGSFYDVRIVIGRDYRQFFPQAVILY
ncbi:MAG: LytR C-terminal domain-containing protein [candidate division WOR-3 bacterium]